MPHEQENRAEKPTVGNWLVIFLAVVIQLAAAGGCFYLLWEVKGAEFWIVLYFGQLAALAAMHVYGLVRRRRWILHYALGCCDLLTLTSLALFVALMLASGWAALGMSILLVLNAMAFTTEIIVCGLCWLALRKPSQATYWTNTSRREFNLLLGIQLTVPILLILARQLGWVDYY